MKTVIQIFQIDRILHIASPRFFHSQNDDISSELYLEVKYFIIYEVGMLLLIEIVLAGGP